ncbi:TIGR04255 family protein [Iamia sp.]|uniref:TIGR04255 family protein n=1 Tax=Iamia sp. TaxID=2722710 RepID=UPI002C432129|nr:TIGR04255 family protein [Iamia sp.]HXH59118.1 TIGR04255 family protein [Iamia sp.]
MALFGLPDPPSYTLSNAPLAQALAQVRFPLIAGFETMAGIAPLQERLRPRFPYMEQVKTQEIAFLTGPAGPAAGASESVSWNLTDDAGYTLAVNAGSATVSVGEAYTSVDDFIDALREVLVALADAGVPRSDRLGVRYLSLAPDLPGESGAWRRWFREELVGWAGSSVLSTRSLVSSVTQVHAIAAAVDDLSGPPGDVQAIVRHGFVPSGSVVPGIPPLDVGDPSYLLDVDVATVGHQDFDPDRLVEQFQLFHSQVDRFFYWTLTEEGGHHFGLEERDG